MGIGFIGIPPKKRRNLKKAKKYLSGLISFYHAFTIVADGSTLCLKTFSQSLFFVSLPEAHHKRLADLGRRLDTSAAAVVRAGIELALPEWEQSRPVRPAAATVTPPPRNAAA
jgi:hypothetical protein